MTTIAIVTCSIVAVIAIIIFLFALMSGALFKTELVKVPNLLGEYYYSGMSYADLSIKVEYSYNDYYANGVIFDQTPSGNEEVAKGTQLKLSVSMGSEPDVKYMENLRGQKEEDALSFLRAQGMLSLSYEEYNSDYEAGRVIRTDPEAGAPLTDGQTIKVYVSKGAFVEKSRVPNLVGMSLEDALEQLEAMGFTNHKVTYVESDENAGKVVEQSVEKFTEVDVTTLIELKVSQGPKESGAKPTAESSEETTAATTAETTQPTTQDPPAPVEVTRNVTISIAAQETDASVSLYSGNDMVAGPVAVKAGDTSCTVTLTASGTRQYEVYIDGVSSGYITVNFDE